MKNHTYTAPVSALELLEKGEQRSRIRRDMAVYSVIVLMILSVLTGRGGLSGLFGMNDRDYYQYVESMVENEDLYLQRSENDPTPDVEFYESSDSPRPYIEGEQSCCFSAALNRDKKTIQTQVLTSTVIDERFRLLTDHNISILYNYDHKKNEFRYSVYLSDEKQKNNSCFNTWTVYCEINADGTLKSISGSRYGNEAGKMTDAEALELYSSYREEITGLLGRMFEFFGEEHFKK